MFLKTSLSKRLAIVAPLLWLAPGALFASMEMGFSAFQQGDYEGALKAWLVEAEQGDPTAQFNVAQLYRLGKGVTQDYEQAGYWYRRASDQGYGPAERNLQLLVAEGHLEPIAVESPTAGGNPDAPAARSRSEPGLAAYQQGDFGTALDTWLPLAAEGDVTAQFNLGQLYRLGKGVTQDDAQAVRWYRRAALQGHPMALHNLRVMLQDERVPLEQLEGIRTIVSGIPSEDTEVPASLTTTRTASASATPGGVTLPRVEMLSQPLITETGFRENSSVAMVVIPEMTPEPPPEPPPQVVESTPAWQPPVPRQRPLRVDTSAIADTVNTGPQLITPAAISAPRAPRMPPVVTMPGIPRLSNPTPAQTLEATVPDQSPPVMASTPPEPPTTPATEAVSTTPPAMDTSDTSVANETRAVAVAEPLDMNSLVVQVETVPVSSVPAASSSGAGARVTDESEPAAEVITVAVLDTVSIADGINTQTTDTASVLGQDTINADRVPHGDEWFRVQDGRSYVIQIMASNRRSHLEGFLEDLDTITEPVTLVNTIRGERPWYVLLLGPYSGYSTASRVLAELPEPVKVNGPWIRRVAKIQSTMR